MIFNFRYIFLWINHIGLVNYRGKRALSMSQYLPTFSDETKSWNIKALKIITKVLYQIWYLYS